jgi:hypothetical protein
MGTTLGSTTNIEKVFLRSDGLSPVPSKEVVHFKE